MGSHTLVLKHGIILGCLQYKIASKLDVLGVQSFHTMEFLWYQPDVIVLFTCPQRLRTEPIFV